MVTIYLLRHGETEYNADGNKYCGRTDIELTVKGIAQATRMNKLLSDCHIDAVFTSPLQRAIRTAAIATDSKYEIIADARLIEVDFGDWEGRRPEEFQSSDPESWHNWLNAPELHKAGNTGETATQVVERLTSFYNELVEKYDGKTVLIVGHNGVNRFFIASQLGMPLKNYRKIIQENSALTVLSLSKYAGLNLLKLNA